MLEVASKLPLGFFRAEKGNGRFGGHSRDADGLCRCDDGESVTLRLPSKVNDGVLDGVHDLHGYALLLDAENLQRRRLRLLGLGVTVDLDAKVGSIRLPVKLGVANAEKVQGTDNLLGRHAHQTDLGGVAANFGRPEAEQLLVRLDTFTLGSGGSPVKVHNAVNLDASLVEQVHAGELVDRDALALDQTGHVLVVSGPLEGGPLLLRRRATLLCLREVEVGERTERGSGSDVPDHIVLAIVVDGESWVALVRDRNGAVRPGDHVLLSRRESNQVDEGMGETGLTGPRWAAPKLHTLSVNGGQIGAERRPLHEGLGPEGTVDNVLGLILLVVPVNSNAVTSVHDELVSAATGGILKKPSQVLLLHKLVDVWRLVLLVNASFAAVSLDIGHLVDAECVLLVERNHVQLPRRGGSLTRGGVFHKCETGNEKCEQTVAVFHTT